MSDSTDEHIARAIVAIRDDGRRWLALVDAHRVAVRAADRRACLLVSLLCAALLVGAVAACAMTVGPALRGTWTTVPILVAMLGLSAALPLYAFGAATLWTAVRVDGASPRRARLAEAGVRSGRALALGAALGAVVAGGLVAVKGTPIAVVLGVGVGAAAGILGWTLARLLQRIAATV